MPVAEPARGEQLGREQRVGLEVAEHGGRRDEPRGQRRGVALGEGREEGGHCGPPVAASRYRPEMLRGEASFSCEASRVTRTGQPGCWAPLDTESLWIWPLGDVA